MQRRQGDEKVRLVHTTRHLLIASGKKKRREEDDDPRQAGTEVKVFPLP